MVLHMDYYHNDHIDHRISIACCIVSCVNVSLQIMENCLYATKKTEKSKWKQQVHQLDSLSKLRRDNMSCD